MSDIKLKDCPFCGSANVQLFETDHGTCWVYCHKCDASGMTANGSVVAIMGWNRALRLTKEELEEA